MSIVYDASLCGGHESSFQSRHDHVPREEAHHPPSKATQPGSSELRHLKSTKQQVLPLKSKYSVFPMNSERLFSSNSDTNQSLSRALSNPFTKEPWTRRGPTLRQNPSRKTSNAQRSHRDARYEVAAEEAARRSGAGN
ncbi:hypothetical protein GGR53DRAFT_453667 [Hypoxylon sp. FL1150]|nr:hypothetical protein GGR53DRAFT_453667 [Hypoxylon sp. FL1150]